MKAINVLLILLFLAISNVSWGMGQALPAQAVDIPLSVREGRTCVIDYEGLKCWGEAENGELNIPALKNPKQVSLGRDHVCALDDEGVKCWGNNKLGQTNVPILANPRQVSAGDWNTCALDDNGVKCWGGNYLGQTQVPHLVNPRQISVGDSFACALDMQGVKCWGWNYSGQLDVPKLKNPKQISAGEGVVCAIDEEGVKCWGSDFFGTVSGVPQYQIPKFISANFAWACALYQNVVACWGDRYGGGHSYEPSLVNPSYLNTDGIIACALDDDGLKCWSRYSHLKVPSNLSFHLFSSLKRTSPPQRSRYYSELTLLEKDLEADPSQIEGKYLFYSLLKPAIESTRSEFFDSVIIPKYRRYVEQMRSQYGLSDVLKMSDSKLGRQIALKHLQAALRVSLDYFSGQDKEGVESVIAAIEIAYNEPNNSNMQAVLASLEQNRNLINLLRSSSKASFLSDAIDLASLWIVKKL